MKNKDFYQQKIWETDSGQKGTAKPRPGKAQGEAKKRTGQICCRLNIPNVADYRISAQSRPKELLVVTDYSLDQNPSIWLLEDKDQSVTQFLAQSLAQGNTSI